MDVLTGFLIGIGGSFIVGVFIYQFKKVFFSVLKQKDYLKESKKLKDTLREGYNTMLVQQQVDAEIEKRKQKEDDKWDYNYYR